ncbi:MAG: hypothetical protein KIS94_06305 [Chitinophagales bacterium]|nr:hypothetical protein [Chitinophagales bacterium]
MKNIGTKSLIAFVALALLLSACKKETIEPVKNIVNTNNNGNNGNNNNQALTNPNSQMEALSTINAVGFKVVRNLLFMKGKTFKTGDFEFETCATVTVDSSSLPYHIVIDWGAGCTERDYTRKRGKIEIEYNNKNFEDAGAYAKATFTDYREWYFSNGNEVKETINGTLEIENLGANGSGNMVVSFKANATSYDEIDEETVSIVANMDYECIAGYGTSDEEDDMFSITGQLDATKGSETLSVAVLTPLIESRAENCNDHIIQGEIRIQESGQPTRYIDYGSGACDNLAIETIDGVPTEIELEGKFY